MVARVRAGWLGVGQKRPREARGAASGAFPSGAASVRGIGAPAIAASVGALGLTGATAVIGVNSAIVDRPAVFVTLQAILSIGLVAVALVMLGRGTNTRMPTILVVTAYAVALGRLTEADSPLPFVIGRIFVPVGVLLAVYVCFAYPSGRTEDRAATRVFVAAASAVMLLLVANVLLSHVPPVAGPFTRCSGSQCPSNPLNIVSSGQRLSNFLSGALALAMTLTTGATVVVVGRRATSATPLQRRSLAPLLLWAALAAVGYGFYVTVRALDAHAELLTPAAVIVVAVMASMPISIAVGLLRGRVFGMAAIERVMTQLAEQSSLAGLQDLLSRGFGDPALALRVWQPSTQTYVDAAGEPAESSAAARGKSVTEFKRNGRRFAALVHDPLLSRDVLDAAASAICLALDNARLQSDLSASISELEASRKRVAWAADAERRRIEQDLHDGAQQGLIALRIKLHLLEELAADSAGSLAPRLADAGKSVDVALDRIRNLAQGIYPSVLRDLGLSYALAALARELPNEVRMRSDLQRRLAPDVETAVYFCCAEALQNVAKHCGREATARVRLSDNSTGLSFAIADNGPGFDTALVARTHGITGMQDRLEAIGGNLTISSQSGRGTTVRGRVPVDGP